MLKISISDSRTQRRLILEGRMIAPWVAELKTACASVKAELHGRELVIDMEKVTVISQEGENALLQLIKDGVRIRSRGVFTKHILQQLARSSKKNANEVTEARPPHARDRG
jgi:hypothetical protein